MVASPSGKGEVTVHVPGLLGPWPAALAGDVSRGLDLPGLAGLLARSRRVRRRGTGVAGSLSGVARIARLGRLRSQTSEESESPERLAFGQFGYPAGEGDVPAAALMWEGDVAASRLLPRAESRSPEESRSAEEASPPETTPSPGEGEPDSRRSGDAGEAGGFGSPDPIRAAAGEAAPGAPAGFVPLRADPVHLRADLDAARLFDASCFALTHEEAAALVGALDRHFVAEGLRFEAPHPTRWYARVERMPDAVFCPPGGAAVRGAGASLPAGSEGRVWRRRMNEIQMVLYAHPVNERREARGEQPVNSVWFWGAGALGPCPPRRFSEVRTDDPLVRALAERGGARVQGLEEGGEMAGSAEGVTGHRLVAPGSGFYRTVMGRDVEAWRRELLEAEERWFGPLFEALKAGRIRKVAIDAGLRIGGAVFETGGRGARRPPARGLETGLAAFLLAGDP